MRGLVERFARGVDGERAATPAQDVSLARCAVAECIGTALLLSTVVGSGIMGERLSGGNAALTLLANSAATGAVLFALISALGPISGAHFNPAVTLTATLIDGFPWKRVAAYVSAQAMGSVLGVWLAHAMFGERIFMISQRARAGAGQFVSEGVATFGLLLILWCCVRLRRTAVAAAVGAYIAGAYWFTASTSFANPAVTVARSLTDTFAGIRPSDVPAFILAQLIGAAGATASLRWLVPRVRQGDSNGDSLGKEKP